MTRFATPCIDCGEPIKATRCDQCQRRGDRLRIRKRSPKTSSTARGYDERWRRLSERARKAQPFCSDCGATTDLQADHLPIAWERYDKGLTLRIKDVDVVCGPCNRKRGPARGKDRRDTSQSKATTPRNNPGVHTKRERPPQDALDPWGRPPSRSQARLPLGPTLLTVTLSNSETEIPGGGK